MAAAATTPEIRSLTALRGVAAIWVVLFHIDLERPFPVAIREVLAIDKGYLAVDVFFALSGFVLALTHAREFRTRPLGEIYPRFLWRRIARVMPLNAVAVTLIVLAVALDPIRLAQGFAGARDVAAVAANLLLIQNWGLAPSIDKPAWSVSIEMAAYLGFPLLLAAVWGRLSLLVGLASVGSLGWLAWSDAGSVSQGLLVGDFIRGVGGVTLGLLAFRYFASGAAPRWLGRLDLGVVALIWAALTARVSDLIAILLAPVLIVALALERGPGAKWLGIRPLHYLGRISYSIYLIHYCVLKGLDPSAIRSNWAYAAATLALTVALSACTSRWIEQPARRWFTRVALSA